MNVFAEMSLSDWIVLGVLLGLFLVQLYYYARYLAAPARRLRKKVQRDKGPSDKGTMYNVQRDNVQCTKDQGPSDKVTKDGYGLPVTGYGETSDKGTKDQVTSDKGTKDGYGLPVTGYGLPGVTVILCAHNESENLSHYLQALLTQDYPAYEVIVVDDGSEDETRAIVEQYMLHDPRLHMTFVPKGARVGSTKKLGLTLGAKAAQYDYLLLTDADCVPESNRWIREMMKGFGDVQRDNVQGTKDIVLGFSPYFKEKGAINRLVRYDTLFNGLHYLGAALCGHPYMGVGRNLAYKKSLFFESGGFTRLMTSKAGDDDLFVNHVATRENTSVVLSRESYVWSLSKKTFKEWWQQKRRHVSVSPQYRGETKWRLMTEPLTRGLFYAMVLVAVTGYRLPVIGYGLPVSGVVSLAAAGLFLVRWILQTAVINTSARRMGLKRFAMFSVLWFDMLLPLINLWMLAVPRRKLKW